MCLRLLLREPTGRHTELETRGFAWVLSVPVACASVLIFQNLLYSTLGSVSTVFALLLLVVWLTPIILPKVFTTFLASLIQEVDERVYYHPV
jgi:magnesium-transporting ATPase (P-type)